MVDGEIISTGGEQSAFQVSLPVTRDQFGEFISGIIGGKERITAYVEDPLYIDLDNCVSLSKAIVERVTSNNETSIVSSEFSIRFSNHRTYTEHSIKALSELAPIGESKTEMIEISLDFLGKFPKYDFPIRQSIRVLISNSLETKKEGEENVYPSALIDVYFVERTWGEDLASLCQKMLGEFSERAKDAGRLKLWVEEKKGWIVGFSAIFSVLIYLILPFFTDLHVSQAVQTIRYDQVTDIRELALFFQETIDPSPGDSVGKIGLFALCTFVFGCLLGLIFSFTRSNPKKVSFGFTKSDILEYENLAQRRRRAATLTVPSAIVAIGTSVALGYIFEISKVIFLQ